MFQKYRGRFAPSPTGPLHRGSLVAALGSWLDARIHGGKWLIRIEDIDISRERRGVADKQIAVLAQFGMTSDEPIARQRTRFAAYEAALEQLRSTGRIFFCSCTRGTRNVAEQNGALASACRRACREHGVGPPASIRFSARPGPVDFSDRACGRLAQDVQETVGDFVVRRSDGIWAYQLAVVVDDAWQGITDVVRGADLLDNTPRQMLLQEALGLPTPRYLHVPLVLDEKGSKMSKHDGARPLGGENAVQELERAWLHLGFEPTGAASVDGFLERALEGWRERWLASAARCPPSPATRETS